MFQKPQPEETWTLYGKSMCTWCCKAKSFLNSKRIEYLSIDLDNCEPEVRQWLKENTTATKLPVIFHNGVYFGCHSEGVTKMKEIENYNYGHSADEPGIF